MSDAIPEDPPPPPADAGDHDDDYNDGGGDAGDAAYDAMDDAEAEDEAAQAAQAAAEVATHGHTADNVRRAGGNNVPADQAVMGAVQDAADGVANFEVTDESGSLVQQRFLQFLTD